MAQSSVAVVGAGMAGLTCARLLAGAGASVTVFDKSRGPSGRLSTRRREAGQWDHGAPFFESVSPDFRTQCQQWQTAGIVQAWDAADTWVGVPRMSALGRFLSRDLALVTGCRVARVQASARGWRLIDMEGSDRGSFDRVVVAVPAPQAAPLLDGAPALQRHAAAVEMRPSHAVLLNFSHPIATTAAVLRPTSGPLRLVVRNTAKPSRPGTECWVAHTAVDWTSGVLEADPASLGPELVDAFCTVVGQSVTPAGVQVHRWRFAQADGLPAYPEGFALDDTRSLGVCGDWCAGGGVEGAWTSGRDLARALTAADGARA